MSGGLFNYLYYRLESWVDENDDDNSFYSTSIYDDIQKLIQSLSSTPFMENEDFKRFYDQLSMIDIETLKINNLVDDMIVSLQAAEWYLDGDISEKTFLKTLDNVFL